MQPPVVLKNPAHKTRPADRRAGYLLRLLRDRPAGWRNAPVVAAFPAETSNGAADKPPVRIFVGTEPGQARAERALVWSILRRRAPDRAYEIHLMKDLAGFKRRFWKTGFTNYRYAIPEWAAGAGRAIYNDVDQIYLADPAEVFDRDMGEAGVLDVDGRDTSVMLIDCARMAPVWPGAAARSEKPQHAAYRAMRDAADMWAPIPAAWNHRDEAYRPGETKVLHYTTLHTQPWRPFGKELRYQAHAHGAVWEELEREADLAGFTIFTAERPTPTFSAIARQRKARPRLVIAKNTAARAAQAIVDADASSALTLEAGPLAGRLGLACAAAGAPTPAAFEPYFETPPTDHVDAALSLDSLHRLPEDDAPWLLNALFRAARRRVHVSVACFDDAGPDGAGTGAQCILPPDWWRDQMAAAARRTPGVDWSLHCRTRPGFLPDSCYSG